MSNVSSNAAQHNQFHKFVIDFLIRQKGYFLILTQDNAFINVMKDLISRKLDIPAMNVMTIFSDTAHLLRLLRELDDKGRRLFLIMEQDINGLDNSILIQQFKAAFPGLHMIILLNDSQKDSRLILQGMGANPVLKPISSEQLLEKIAFTLKPQVKFGKLIELGTACIKHGEYEKANAIARQILDFKPGSMIGLLLLGDAQDGLGQQDLAKISYIKAHELTPDALDPLYRITTLCKTKGDQECYVAYLKKLEELSPANVAHKMELGSAHMEGGNVEDAEEMFNAAMNQMIQKAFAELSVASERIGNLFVESIPQTATKFMRQAISLKGDYLTENDVNLFNLLGLSLRKEGKWVEAVEAYTRALEILPLDENLLYNLGMAHTEGGQFNDARLCMMKALKVNPKYPYSSARIAFNIGMVFLNANSPDQARIWNNVALELDPNIDKPKAIATHADSTVVAKDEVFSDESAPVNGDATPSSDTATPSSDTATPSSDTATPVTANVVNDEVKMSIEIDDIDDIDVASKQ